MRAAFLAFNKCAFWQVALLQMFLRNCSVAIDTVTLDGGTVTTDGGIQIAPTLSVGQADSTPYSLIFMAGGEFSEDVYDNAALQQFIRSAQCLIAASCGSSLVLAASGVLTGQFTSMPQTVDQHAKLYQSGVFTNTDVCVDKNIITSKGYAHYDFMMAVLEHLGFTNQDPHLPRIALKLSKNL